MTAPPEAVEHQKYSSPAAAGVDDSDGERPLHQIMARGNAGRLRLGPRSASVDIAGFGDRNGERSK